MKNGKGHKGMLIFSIAIALLTTEYYQLMVNGSLSFAWKTILVFLAFAAALFALAELARLFGKKVIIPLTEGKKYGKAYGIMAALSLVVSILFMLAYFLLRKGGEPFGLKHVGFTAAGGLILFLLFGGEILLANTVPKDRKEFPWFRFGIREFTMAVLCLMLTIFCLSPVLSDIVYQNYPQLLAPKTVMYVGWDNGYDNLGEVIAGRTVCQTFLCTTDSIRSIELFAATYARENNSHLQISLTEEETGKLIQLWNLNAIDFKDYSAFTIEIDNKNRPHGAEGKRYRLDITSEDAEPGNALTLYYSTNDYYPDGEMYIDGEPVVGDLIGKVNGTMIPEDYERVRIWLCVYNALLVHIAVFVLFRKSQEKRKPLPDPAKEPGV